MTRPRAEPADFAAVERQAARLRKQFEAGELDESTLKARLKDLMIQDQSGRWWIVGYETGRWYVHTDGGWSEGEPPPPEGRRSPAEARRGPAEAAGEFSTWRMLLLLIGAWVVTVLLIAPIAGELGGWQLMKPMAGLAFGLLAGVLLRKTESSLRPRHIGIITLAWGLGQFPPFSLVRIFYGFRYGGLAWAPEYLLGGVVTALVLRWVNPRVRWFVIALGWAGATLVLLIFSRG